MNFWTGFMMGQAGQGGHVEKIVIERTSGDEVALLIAGLILLVFVAEVIVIFIKKNSSDKDKNTTSTHNTGPM